jgi:hypothetical protein
MVGREHVESVHVEREYVEREHVEREHVEREHVEWEHGREGTWSKGNIVEREHGRERTWSGGNNLHCGKDHIVGNLTLVQCVNNFPYTSSMEDF